MFTMMPTVQNHFCSLVNNKSLVLDNEDSNEVLDDNNTFETNNNLSLDQKNFIQCKESQKSQTNLLFKKVSNSTKANNLDDDYSNSDLSAKSICNLDSNKKCCVHNDNLNLTRTDEDLNLEANRIQTSFNSNENLTSNLKDERKWKFSKTHQKRFHRRFPDIEKDEQLIEWFSCALLADILLQGYLYISKNYFAFYSNIFGYKTHILIKISDVSNISKEKTAKIFPNAVGISIKDNKFVFGSLLSRESTFKLLNEVRDCYLNTHKQKSNENELNACSSTDELSLDKVQQITEQEQKQMCNSLNLNEKENHSSLNQSNLDLKNKNQNQNRKHKKNNSVFIKDELDKGLSLKLKQNLINQNLKRVKNIFLLSLKTTKTTFLLLNIILLLIILFVSISILLYRFDKAYNKMVSIPTFGTSSIRESFFTHELFKIINVLNNNLNEIDQFKKILENFSKKVSD